VPADDIDEWQKQAKTTLDLAATPIGSNPALYEKEKDRIQ